MSRKPFLTLAATLVAAALLLSAPVFAGSIRTPFEAYQILCVVDPGTQWVDGTTLHIRGQLAHEITYGPPTFEIVGQNSLVINSNIDLVTGYITTSGSFSLHYLPASPTGTFDGRLNARGIGEDWRGKAVGHGTGDLKGQKIKGVIQPVPLAEVPPELLYALTQPPWTECPQIGGVFRNVGYIQHR